MAITLTHTNSDAGGVSPHGLTVTSTAAGSLLVVGIVLVDNTKVVSSVVSNAGSGLTTFAQATSAKATNTTFTTLTDIWYLYNAGSATSITITATASIGAAFCFEYAGATGGSFDTASAANNLAAAATETGPAITTAIAGEVIFAVCADSNNCTSATAPYATDFKSSTSGHAASDHITTTTVSAETCVFHDSTSGGGCVSAAAFKPSSFTYQQLEPISQPQPQSQPKPGVLI